MFKIPTYHFEHWFTVGLMLLSAAFLMIFATSGWTIRVISGMSIFCWRCNNPISSSAIFFSMEAAILSPSRSALPDSRTYDLHKQEVKIWGLVLYKVPFKEFIKKTAQDKDHIRKRHYLLEVWCHCGCDVIVQGLVGRSLAEGDHSQLRVERLFRLNNRSAFHANHSGHLKARVMNVHGHRVVNGRCNLEDRPQPVQKVCQEMTVTHFWTVSCY